MDSLSSKPQLSTSQIKVSSHPTTTDTPTQSEELSTTQPLDQPKPSSQPNLDLTSNPIAKKLDQVSTQMLVESSSEIKELAPTVKDKVMSEKAQLVHEQKAQAHLDLLFNELGSSTSSEQPWVKKMDPAPTKKLEGHELENAAIAHMEMLFNELGTSKPIGPPQDKKLDHSVNVGVESSEEVQPLAPTLQGHLVSGKSQWVDARIGNKHQASKFEHPEKTKINRMTELFQQVKQAGNALIEKTTYELRVVESVYFNPHEQEQFLSDLDFSRVTELPYGDMVKHLENAFNSQNVYERSKLAWSLAMKSPEDLKEMLVSCSRLSEEVVIGDEKLTHLTYALFNTAMKQVQSQGGVTVNDDDVPPKMLTVKGVTYTKGEKLGAGSYGHAFMYTSESGEKLVLKHFKTSDIKSMQNEARAHHEAMGPKDEGNPNLLKLKGMIYNEGINHQPGLIMTLTEPASGGEMRDLHKRLNVLVETKVINREIAQLIGRRLMVQVLEGMLYLQRDRQIIHYDLKPENIFLTEDGSVKIADFGFASVGKQGQGGKGSSMYMSPESHLSKEPIDFHTDTWSLGVITRELFKGELKLPNVAFLESGEIADGLHSFRKNDQNRTIVVKENMDGKSDVVLNSLGNYGEILNAMMHPDPLQRPNLEVVSQHPFFADPALDGEKLQALIKMVLTLPKVPTSLNKTDEEIGLSMYVQDKHAARQERDRFVQALEQLKPMLKQMEKEVHQEVIRL